MLPASEAIALCLTKGWHVSSFERLALVSKRLLMDVGRHLIQHLVGKPNGLLALDHHSPAFSSTSPGARLCITWAIAFGDALLPSPAAAPLSTTVREFMALYHHGFRARLAMAREIHPDCRYTFHMVTRWVVHGTHAAPSFQEKASRTGGELAVHKFICIKETQDALRFLQHWAHVQAHSHGPHATCMMECGPAAPTLITDQPQPQHYRKWIIDLDGKLDDLQSLGFLEPGEACTEEQRTKMQAQVVAFGSAISHALHSTCRFLDAPCYFALKSRHKTKEGVPGYSMLSWHLTLLAMAPYDDWRRAMQYVEKHVYPQAQKQPKDGPMRISLLSDAHITRNSKGQFIQTLFSEKVEAGVSATGRRFTLDGIFTPDGVPIHLASIPHLNAISLMATSMVLPDPWSRRTFHPMMMPMAPEQQQQLLDEGKDTLFLGNKLKRKHNTEEGASCGGAGAPKQSHKKPPPLPVSKLYYGHPAASWEALPASDSRWIRGLLDGGSTCTLGAIASMKDEKLMPMAVTKLLRAGRARLEFYAVVRHALLCPRHLKLGNTLHTHRNHDNLAAVCITENVQLLDGQSMPCVRLFVRCFSVKCMTQYQKCAPTSINWLELTSAHFLRYNRLCASSSEKDPQ